MSLSILEALAKTVADAAVFLEFSGEEIVDEDSAVEAMEQMAAGLQELSDKDRAALSAELQRISSQFPEEEKQEFVEGLPESFGLI